MIEILTNESFLALLAIHIIAALGMHIVYSTGQLNLGQAGFMAIGAYTAAVTDRVLDWPLASSLGASAVVAASIALPIAWGTSRVRGVYLIMGTLAVGEVVRILIGNIEPLGGLQGYSGITPVTLPEVVVVLIAALVGTGALMSSPLGLQMRAVFDDEVAAAAAGVATRRVKVLSVVISAAVVAIAGGLSAKWLLFIAPRNFGVDLSFRIALFTLVGGVHSVLGSVAGASLVTYLLEALRAVGSMEGLPHWIRLLGPWRQVVYGIAIVALMAVRPEGLISRQWALFLTAPFRKWRRTVSGKRATPRSEPAGRTGSEAKTDQPLLQIDRLSHRFGGLSALQGVSLTVYRGEILALIGANGAGKTTLADVVSGRYALQEGTICMSDEGPDGLSAKAPVPADVSRTFQSVRVFAHLTVEEDLRLGRLAGGDGDSPFIEDVLALVGLSGKPDALPDTLTLAEQRRLEIGRAIASAPRIVFLDEPSAGMNEAERRELGELILRVRAWGTTVVLIEHNLDLALSVADRVVVLDFGRVIAVGPPRDVVDDPRVRAAYLGSTEVSL